MVSISLCMIVKNEENTLGSCLESVKDIVDEIIIVDTGSTDKTKDIALKYTNKIYDFKWCSDFSKARNKSFEYATKDFILWLDADDVISHENALRFIKLKETLTLDIGAVNMIYSLSRDENENTIYSLRRNRLINRKRNYKWIGFIHEYINVLEEPIFSDIEIWHKKEAVTYSNRNLLLYREMEEKNVPFSQRDIFYFGNELFYHSLWEEAIEKYVCFLKEDSVWIEDKKLAYLNMAKCLNNLNKKQEAKEAILTSFSYDIPRADSCCFLGELFLEEENYLSSIFWYQNAIKCAPNKNYTQLLSKDYYTYIPYVQLCICYYFIEDYYSSYYYNELVHTCACNKNTTLYNRNLIIDKFNELNIPIPNKENIFSVKNID